MIFTQSGMCDFSSNLKRSLDSNEALEKRRFFQNLFRVIQESWAVRGESYDPPKFFYTHFRLVERETACDCWSITANYFNSWNTELLIDVNQCKIGFNWQ